MFKILALVAVIYAVFRFQSMKKIDQAPEEDPGEEFVDYEEVDE